jgi:hypothetical protein
MLTSYALSIWLALRAGPPVCGESCLCVVPASADVSSHEKMARYAGRGAYSIVLATVIGVDTTARDSVKVDSTSTTPRYFVYPTVTRYTLAVERTWKGPLVPTVTIADYNVRGPCSRPYAIGQEYLVYAEKDQRSDGPTELTTAFCSRVMLKSQASMDRRLLGAGRVPDG